MSGNTLLFRRDIEPILQEALWIFERNAIEKGSSYLTCDLSFLVDKFNEEVGEVQELKITETMCEHDKEHAIKELCDTINQSFMLAYRLRESMSKKNILYCSNCGFDDDSCGCNHPNLKKREERIERNEE